ncbi:hypothetical protein [Actinomadura craniellae]|nr:hypothetical protein [Actinomadura craniellae]
MSLRAVVLLTIAGSVASLTIFFPEVAIPIGVGVGILTLLHKVTGS